MWKFLMIGAITVSSAIAIAGQDEGSVWEVPADAKAVKNPVENNADAVAAGQKLYDTHCKMCHGDAAKGDGAATQFIKPAPPDISTAEAKARLTDGEIFYKITTGKRPMPAMQRKLSETERWQVVHFLRTLQGT